MILADLLLSILVTILLLSIDLVIIVPIHATVKFIRYHGTEVSSLTFGERLRQLREERNLTQKAIAGIIGISPRMVSFYESGAHFPREEGTLLKLAQFFGVSTDYLLGYSDVRCVEQLRKLNQAFQGLPEAERESLMDYLDFLSAKQKRPKP